MGGAAMILGYGMARATEDADLLHSTAELEAMVESADLGHALARTNEDLSPLGLYLSHIWGPEQQILSRGWERACRPVRFDPPLSRLQVLVLGPVDLLLSKLCRADTGDLADIRWLIAHEGLSSEVVRRAMVEAVVPAAFTEGYPLAVARVEAILSGETGS